MDIRVNLDTDKIFISGEIYFYYADIFVDVFGDIARNNSDNIFISMSATSDNGSVAASINSSINRVSSWNGPSFTIRLLDLLPATDYHCILSIAGVKDSTFSFDMTTPYPPKQYSSWIWDISSLSWEAPVEYPDDGFEYSWNEDLVDWELVEVIEES